MKTIAKLLAFLGEGFTANPVKYTHGATGQNIGTGFSIVGPSPSGHQNIEWWRFEPTGRKIDKWLISGYKIHQCIYRKNIQTAVNAVMGL